MSLVEPPRPAAARGGEPLPAGGAVNAPGATTTNNSTNDTTQDSTPKKETSITPSEQGSELQRASQQVAICSDILREVFDALSDGNPGIEGVAKPLLDEVFSCVFSGYDEMMEWQEKHKEQAKKKKQEQQRGTPRRRQEVPPLHAAKDAKDGEEEEDRGEPVVVPWFVRAAQLEEDIRATEQVTRVSDSLQAKVATSEANRFAVFEQAIHARQVCLMTIAFQAWRENARESKQQRLALNTTIGRMQVDDERQRRLAYHQTFMRLRLHRYRKLKTSADALRERLAQLQTDLSSTEDTCGSHRVKHTKASTELNRCKGEVERLEARLAELQAQLDLIDNQKPSRTVSIVAEILVEALNALDAELMFALYRGGSRVGGQPLFDPRVMFDGMYDPETAAAQLESMDDQSLILFWLNYHVAQSGGSRKVYNFSFDLQDSEVIARLLTRINPTMLDDGTSVPKLSLRRIITDRQDLEERAGALLAYAKKADTIIRASEKQHQGTPDPDSAATLKLPNKAEGAQEFIHELIKPRDLVSSRFPDITAAWLGQMFCERFAIPVDRARVHRGVLRRIAELRTEVQNLIESCAEVVSVEWLSRVLREFLDVFEESEVEISGLLRAGQLSRTLRGRVSNFVAACLQRRLGGDPMMTVNYSVDMERRAVIASLRQENLHSVLQHEAEPHRQLAAVRMIIGAQFERIKRVFTYYSQGDFDTAAETMSWSEFSAFAADVGLPVPVTRSRKSKASVRKKHRSSAEASATGLFATEDDPEQPRLFTEVELTGLFMSVAAPQARLGLKRTAVGAVAQAQHLPVTVLLELMGDVDQQTSSVEERQHWMAKSRRSRRSSRAAHGPHSPTSPPPPGGRSSLPRGAPMSVSAPSSDDGPEVTLGQFAELVVRLAHARYERSQLAPTTSGKLQLFLREMFKRGRQLDTQSFLSRVRDDSVLEQFQVYRSRLVKIFIFYSAAVSDVSDATDGRSKKKSKASDNKVFENTIDWDEFLTMVDDLQLLVKAGFDEPTRTLTERQLAQVFDNAQLRQPKDPGAKDTGEQDMKSGELRYNDFLQALTALACYVFPTPFEALSRKFARLCDEVVFPSMSRKVRQGVAGGQGAAVRNLLF